MKRYKISKIIGLHLKVLNWIANQLGIIINFNLLKVRKSITPNALTSVHALKEVQDAPDTIITLQCRDMREFVQIERAAASGTLR